VIQNRYLRYFYYHLFRTSAGGLLVPEGTIRSVIRASAQTRIIRYIYFS